MPDTSYLTDGRRYLTTIQAAHYVGFEPTPDVKPRHDRAIRSFWEWARRKGIHACAGREGMWERRDLDDAMHRKTTPERFSTIAEMARADVKNFVSARGRK